MTSVDIYVDNVDNVSSSTAILKLQDMTTLSSPNPITARGYHTNWFK